MKTLATVLTLALGMFAFAGQPMAKQAPASIEGAKTVTAAEAKVLFDKGIKFVDVRKVADWDAGRIPGATHIELKKKLSPESLAAVVAKEREVVIYCNGEKCMRSSKACKKAVSWGFSKVHYFRTGFPSWQAAGYPVE